MLQRLPSIPIHLINIGVSEIMKTRAMNIEEQTIERREKQLKV
jgi:hypothetical protein